MIEHERLAIEHECGRLISLYANLNDASRWEDVAALYTPNGRMARPSAPDDWITGRETILAAFTSRPARRTRHVCSNVVIDVVDARHATGESTMLLFTGPEAPPLVGFFLDRFELTDEGWRFAERRGGLTF